MLFRQALPALLFSANWVCRAFCTAVYDLLKLNLLLFIDKEICYAIIALIIMEQYS